MPGIKAAWLDLIAVKLVMDVYPLSVSTPFMFLNFNADWGCWVRILPLIEFIYLPVEVVSTNGVFYIMR